MTKNQEHIARILDIIQQTQETKEYTRINPNGFCNNCRCQYQVVRVERTRDKNKRLVSSKMWCWCVDCGEDQ